MLQLNDAFKYYNIKYTTYNKWIKENQDAKNIDYYLELLMTGQLEKLIDRISNEVFYIMFINRELLMRFNDMMASAISGLKLTDIYEDENRQYFLKDGVLKRVPIPEWVKRAIYYRDRGRCVLCNKDLSGMLSSQNKINYDHIIPLALGGLNDITNLQLLCDKCNQKKPHHSVETSSLYEK